jgi:hypothetical protein
VIRYFLFFIPVAILIFYFYSLESTENKENIAIGDAYSMKISAPANRIAYFKRISATQFIFTFLEEGAYAEIGELSNARLEVGQELRLASKNCVFSFEAIGQISKGRIVCGDFSESDFQADLMKLDAASFQLSHVASDNTIKMLGELENLSDEILELTSDIVSVESIIAKLQKGNFDTKQKELKELPLESGISREILLRTSIEGQEIALATRLLDEEGKIYLGVQKFNKTMPETPSSFEAAQSPAAIPTVVDGKPTSKSEEWWKNID